MQKKKRKKKLSMFKCLRKYKSNFAYSLAIPVNVVLRFTYAQVGVCVWEFSSFFFSFLNFIMHIISSKQLVAMITIQMKTYSKYSYRSYNYPTKVYWVYHFLSIGRLSNTILYSKLSVYYYNSNATILNEQRKSTEKHLLCAIHKR